MPFESEGYIDRILREIGLSSYREGRFGDYLVPGSPQGLVGLKNEHLARCGGGVSSEFGDCEAETAATNLMAT